MYYFVQYSFFDQVPVVSPDYTHWFLFCKYRGDRKNELLHQIQMNYFVYRARLSIHLSTEHVFVDTLLSICNSRSFVYSPYIPAGFMEVKYTQNICLVNVYYFHVLIYCIIVCSVCLCVSACLSVVGVNNTDLF